MIETTQLQDVVVRLSLEFGQNVLVDLLIDDVIVISSSGKNIGIAHTIDGISAGEHDFTYIVTPDVSPTSQHFDVLKYNQLTLHPVITSDINEEQLQVEIDLANLNVSSANGATTIHATPNTDIVPIQAVIDAHDATIKTANQKLNTIVTLSRSDMIIFYRDALVTSAGNGAGIAILYTQANAYEAQNSKLTDTITSLRTIEELGSGVNIDIGTNQGKARYLQLFGIAIVLWSV